MRKMSAFDLLPPRSVPLNFSGAVPMLSWRFDLMYLQNGLELFWASPSWMVLFTKFHSAWRKSFTFLLGVPVVCPRSRFSRRPVSIESPLLLGEAP